jgi:hypothetical protein
MVRGLQEIHNKGKRVWKLSDTRGFAIDLTWQEDRAVAAGTWATGCRGRKVRTPQGSVPDNVRDVRFKARRRPVPQKRYRLGYPFLEGHP